MLRTFGSCARTCCGVNPLFTSLRRRQCTGSSCSIIIPVGPLSGRMPPALDHTAGCFEISLMSSYFVIPQHPPTSFQQTGSLCRSQVSAAWGSPPQKSPLTKSRSAGPIPPLFHGSGSSGCGCLRGLQQATLEPASESLGHGWFRDSPGVDEPAQLRQDVLDELESDVASAPGAGRSFVQPSGDVRRTARARDLARGGEQVVAREGGGITHVVRPVSAGSKRLGVGRSAYAGMEPTP